MPKITRPLGSDSANVPPRNAQEKHGSPQFASKFNKRRVTKRRHNINQKDTTPPKEQQASVMISALDDF
jgi:hypothetical protein